MNVCLRGSSSGSMALWKRCAGNRRALSHSYKAGEVGFRLNGVIRGGRYGSSPSHCYRSSYKSQRDRDYHLDGMAQFSIGFRCEWCNTRWGL